MKILHFFFLCSFDSWVYCFSHCQYCYMAKPEYTTKKETTLNFKIHLLSSKFPQGIKHIIRFGKPGWPVSRPVPHLPPVSNHLIPTLSHLSFFTYIQLSLQLLFLNVSWNSRLPFALFYIFFHSLRPSPLIHGSPHPPTTLQFLSIFVSNIFILHIILYDL